MILLTCREAIKPPGGADLKNCSFLRTLTKDQASVDFVEVSLLEVFETLPCVENIQEYTNEDLGRNMSCNEH